MRILHTSDWHLGQHFMGKTRQAEHAAFIAWLLHAVEAHGVDAVLIAGDIFDTGAPPSYAREMLNQLVVELSRRHVSLLLLAGNHDSPATLAESKALLACLGVQVIEGAAADPAAQSLLLTRRDGTPGAVVCAVPFVRARELARSEAGQSAGDKQRALADALAAHYQAVWQAACALNDSLGGGLPMLATGHLATVGASSSESVREIYIGSLDAFSSAAFPPADYVALGHIHRPQRVGGLAHIRYSGSPIPLSFDEAQQDKEVLLVDLASGVPAQVTPLVVPRSQALASVSASLAVLPARLNALVRELAPGQRLWLDVEIVADDYLPDLAARVASLCEGLPLEVLRVRRARSANSAQLAAVARETLAELAPREVFVRRIEGEVLDDALRRALLARFDEVLASLGDVA